MAKLPQVTALAGAKNQIAFDYRTGSNGSGRHQKGNRFLEIGKDYVYTMNLKMAAGRSFNNDMQSDYSNAILVTGKYVAMYGWKPKKH